MSPVSRGQATPRLRFHWVGVLGLAWILSARALAAASSPPLPEAGSALAPYAMWVGRQPATEEATWAERKRLAFLRGRLGAWLEAEYQVRAMRTTPARHAELCVQLARAARYSEDWARALTWITTARESMNRVSAGERPFDLVADYYDEAVALREVTDVRVAYAAMVPFLGDESARRESLQIFQRLVDLAVVAGDEDSYTKLATSLLTTTRAWTREVPSEDGGPSEADRALGAYVETLITRGYAGTAAQLADTGIADEPLRQSLAQAASVAGAAKEDDAAITRFLANQSTLGARDAALFGLDEPHAGIVTWLARGNRADFAYHLLAEARDRVFSERDGAARALHERAWNTAVLRVAAAYWQAGRPAEAVRLGQLFSATRTEGDATEVVKAGVLIDLREGLIGFATWLGEHGQTGEARRLLETLPLEYPQRDDESDGPEQYRAMRADAADAVLQQQRVTLALAWAAAGDAVRATEGMNRLPAEDRTDSARWALTRQRILAGIATAAAIAGDNDLATRAADEARDAHVTAHGTSAPAALVLVPSLVLTGRHGEAWERLTDLRGAAPEAVIAQIVAALVARERGNRVLEWISAAPDGYRGAAWRAFFTAAAPEPLVPPVRRE